MGAIKFRCTVKEKIILFCLGERVWRGEKVLEKKDHSQPSTAISCGFEEIFQANLDSQVSFQNYFSFVFKSFCLALVASKFI